MLPPCTMWGKIDGKRALGDAQPCFIIVKLKGGKDEDFFSPFNMGGGGKIKDPNSRFFFSLPLRNAEEKDF